MVNELGATGRLEELERLYTQLNQVMGEQVGSSLGATLENATRDGSGISGAVTTFFNAWESFAATPGDATAKEVLFQSADELAARLNAADKALDEAAADQDARLRSETEQATALLSRIATFNSRSSARRPGSPAATELRDARQKAIEELGGIMDFISEAQPDGSITLRLADGTTELVQGGQAATITVNRDESGTANGLRANMGGGGANFAPTRGTLSVLHPSVGLTQIADMRGELDALAGQLSEQVNIAYRAAGAGDFFSGTLPAPSAWLCRRPVPSPRPPRARPPVEMPWPWRLPPSRTTASAAPPATASTAASPSMPPARP
jgi:flagellar hook-associated protein 1 FlgK